MFVYSYRRIQGQISPVKVEIQRTGKVHIQWLVSHGQSSPHVTESGIRNPEKFSCWNPESRTFFYVGIRNPVSWNPESTKVLESGIYFCRNPLVSNCFGRFFYSVSTQSLFSGPPLTLLHLRHSKHVFELVHSGHTPPRARG